jgi:hypothetical protein
LNVSRPDIRTALAVIRQVLDPSPVRIVSAE